MARRKKPKRKPSAEPPKIHEATLASGPSGVVFKGVEIDVAEAVTRRQAGLDIVVCEGNRKANKNLARQIETAVGPYEPQEPHASAGPHALPHYQPAERPPAGHSFYETENPARKARKQR